MKELIQADRLSKTFLLSSKQQKLEHTKNKKKKAVSDVSFTAYEGEIFGLLGPNGAGKTTTLKMLATLLHPDTGDAIIDGSSIVTEEEEVRRKIAFLTSELHRMLCMISFLIFIKFQKKLLTKESGCFFPPLIFKNLRR